MDLNDIYDGLDADMNAGGTVKYGGISVTDINKASSGAWWWTRGDVNTHQGASYMAQTKIGSFLCPSDAPYQVDRHDPFVSIYFWFDGSTGWEEALYLNNHGSDQYGRTNYLGSAGFLGLTGLPYFDNRRGVFFNRSKTNIRDITDGSSKTLLFGEAMAGDDDQSVNSSTSWAYTWFGAGNLAIAFSLTDSPGWGSFSSRHPKIVQFCMADGAVVGLSTSLDKETYLRLGSISDDLPAEVPN